MTQHFLALLRLFGAPRTAPRRRNLGCAPPRGLILSQWWLPDYRVGLGRFGRVGCEICAVYNVLLRCGKAVPLWEIIDSFTARRSLMLLGLGGTDPFTIGPWLAARGVTAQLYGGRRAFDAFCAAARQDGLYIVSYWTRPWNLHTVAFAVRCGVVEVWNAGQPRRRGAVEDIAPHLRRRFILGYRITEPLL